jgi:dienelactone hydrolase
MGRPPGPGPFPAVLVLSGCEGVGPLETKTDNELAKLGYVAVSIDTLAPQGLKNACTTPDAFVTSARYAYVTLGWLAQQPYVIPDRLGVVGFSMGALEIMGLQILDGDADDWNPAPPCQRLAQAATDAGNTVQITTFPGATHAFNQPGPPRTYLGHALRYDADADRDADGKAIAFLATYLK